MGRREPGLYDNVPSAILRRQGLSTALSWLCSRAADATAPSQRRAYANEQTHVGSARIVHRRKACLITSQAPPTGSSESWAFSRDSYRCGTLSPHRGSRIHTRTV